MEKVITDKSRRHRLTMHLAAGGKGANFHSLTWAVRNGSSWSDRVVIAREAFQPPNRHRRWIADLHSFDPETGRAIQCSEQALARLSLISIVDLACHD